MTDNIALTGRIATEPELKFTPTGVPFTKFRLASTKRRFDDATKTWIDGETNWYTVSTWRRLGEHAYASFKKGQRVVLTGRLRIRVWDNSSGKGFSADVDADAIGHDLQWGTTTYHPEERSARTAPQQSVESWETTTPGEGVPATIDRDGGWAVPGAEPSSEAPPEPEPEPVLVGADEETPF